MDEWQKRALQFLALASASAALPAGAVLIAYSVWNDFFPTLIETVSVPQLVFISVVVAFVFLAGLFFGMGLVFWLLWLTVKLWREKDRKWVLPLLKREIGLRGVSWSCGLLWLVIKLSPGGSRQHILLPPEHWIRRPGVALSCGMFVLVFRTLSRSTVPGHNEMLELIGYFCAIGGCMIACVGAADGWNEKFRRLLPLFVVISFGLLFMPNGVGTSLLNTCMSTMGFRSAPAASVLVDEDAFQRVEALVGPVAVDPDACAVAIGARTFWHLKQAVVVWTGVGADTLVSTGQPGLPPLRLNPDQVMVLPAWRVRAGALLPDCERAPANLPSHPA